MVSPTAEQNKAICHLNGAACIIAGAGTGKTTALAHRIFFLINERGIAPERILVTTFTRKATAELYDRAYRQLGDLARRLRISTIDAFIWECARDAMKNGLMSSSQLIGEAKQRILLLQCLYESLGHNSRLRRSAWIDNVDKANLVDLLGRTSLAEAASGQEKQTIIRDIKSKLKGLEKRWYDIEWEFRWLKYKELNKIADEYHKKLVKLKLIDYVFLNRDFLQCLKTNRGYTKRLASKWDALLVDEFQDTSRAQAEILLLQSGKMHNIWVVGDPCQQIYEWRGAGPKNFPWFIKRTGARKYYLTENWRSTQLILDCAYRFGSKRLPDLRREGWLKRLKSKYSEETILGSSYPIYTGTLDRALFFVRKLLTYDSNIKPADIALLSRKLSRTTLERIKQTAKLYNLKVQFHSSRADHAMELTLGNPPPWKPGGALKNLYKDPKIQKRLARSLRAKKFADIRTLLPLATAAEALDSTLPPNGFSFKEAWPALKHTQDREVSVTSAVVDIPDALQVMTIHAAKGLEFPFVILMQIGKGGPRSFPDPNNLEDSRLVYVGTTRAMRLLTLVHSRVRPTKALSAFGPDLVPIRCNGTIPKISSEKRAPTILPVLPLIAASHLDLYEQCPLKFSAYHEGRLLPKWSVRQSMGSRMHKALEYYLGAGMPANRRLRTECFAKGVQEGDSKCRVLPPSQYKIMKNAYDQLVADLSRTSERALAIEERYRYLHEDGQIEGVVDAVIEHIDGGLVLREWKTSQEINPDLKRQYELQARTGALALAKQGSHHVKSIEVVPLLAPANSLNIPYDEAFEDLTMNSLSQVFKDLRDRRYVPKIGRHCKWCDLRTCCPGLHRS